MANVSLPTWGALALSLLRASDYQTEHTANPGLYERSAPSIDKLKSRRIDSLLYWKSASDVPEQRLYDRLWRLQRDTLTEIVSRSCAAGIEPIVFKGAEFLSSCFASRSVGMLYDVDLLIPRSRIEEMKVVAHGMGLRQGIFDRELRALAPRDVADIARLELSHYELAPFQHVVEVALPDDELAIATAWDQHPIYPLGNGKAAFVIEVDIHHQVALDIPSETLIARGTASAIPGAKTLSPPDLVWFTTSRLYAEVAMNGKRSLRDFAYLAAYLRQTDIDWDVLIQASAEYDLAPSLFYYLSFLGTFEGVDIPPEALDQLDPRKMDRLRDWGWQLAPLLGFIDPAPLALGPEALEGRSRPAGTTDALRMAQAT